MSFQKYRSLKKAISALRKRGYRYDFDYRRGRLVIKSTGIHLDANDLIIEEFHRFKDKGEDQTIKQVVFALETTGGDKGILLIQYDLKTNMDLIKFMNTVPVRSANRQT